MRPRSVGRLLIACAALALFMGIGTTRAQASAHQSKFDTTVAAVMALPYQAAYVPAGTDSAFASETPPVANDAPAQDYTSGSIPGSPDSPAWPPNFKQVLITGTDGAKFFGELALLPGKHPAVLVVHGFNTHGYQSVIRWAAVLAANGYNVLAADQRDFSFENSAGYGYPKQMQTFGWKESQDVVTAGQYLKSQPGVTSIGVVGFSEGAQNTILALGQDTKHIFTAGLTFSGPADQDTQVYSTAVPANCQTNTPPGCAYPATDALIALVVPPNTYTDPCTVLADAATHYHTTPYAIMAHESAMHVQPKISVPLLNFYSNDDSLVNPVMAELMAAYEAGKPTQRTILIQKGEHAYFYDRWWQQMAILTYFHNLLPNTPTTTMTATVNQTPGGSALSTQTVAIPHATKKQADALLAPYICDTTKPSPGKS